MIVVSYGKDIEKSTTDALVASDIGEYMKRGMRVSIKPNLVVPGPSGMGATTHTEVVSGIIRFLKDFGIADIRIIESSWVGDSTKRAFKFCNYEELSALHAVPLIDLKDDAATEVEHGGMKFKVCNEALNTDFLINVPVLKAHSQTRLTCCMKNLKGCIPDNEKRRFHALGLHKPIAALNKAIKTGYCIVDGICGDLSSEEGGTPVESNRIIAGRNPLTIDSYCAELIGYKPEDIEHINQGVALGIGELFSKDISVVEINTQEKPVRVPKANRAADRFSSLINEDAACSACYSSLIYALHKLHGNRLKSKIHIGQGFCGKGGSGVGVGNCAIGYERNVAGCPPKATDIADMLRNL